MYMHVKAFIHGSKQQHLKREFMWRRRGATCKNLRRK
jgi:hypothetical protein